MLASPSLLNTDEPMSERAYVCAFMPRYGRQVYPEAARSFWEYPCRWSEDGVYILDRKHNSQSICFNFNIAFAHALDLRDFGAELHGGGRAHATHFAMLHDDLATEPYWMDILLQEMRENGLAVISAVAPIKDPVPDPRTSTAISNRHRTFDTPHRYITISDRDHLPTTFTLEDCWDLPNYKREPDDELLINTGCMLIDLRHPAWDAFETPAEPGGPCGWSLDSRIVKQENGRRRVSMRPEDWEMSRFLRRHGVPYGATWAVELLHFGEYAWSNRSVRHAV